MGALPRVQRGRQRHQRRCDLLGPWSAGSHQAIKVFATGRLVQHFQKVRVGGLIDAHQRLVSKHIFCRSLGGINHGLLGGVYGVVGYAGHESYVLCFNCSSSANGWIRLHVHPQNLHLPTGVPMGVILPATIPN